MGELGNQGACVIARSYEMKASGVTVGMPVRLAVESADVKIPDGAITAIDPTIDSTTRTIKARASVPNKEEKLRPARKLCSIKWKLRSTRAERLASPRS